MRKNNLEETFTGLTATLMGYFITMIFTGVYKVNIITSYLPLEIASSANISGYVSLTVASFISILVIILIFFILFFCDTIFDFGIPTAHLVESINLSVLIFIAFELLKLVLALVLIDQDLSQIVYDEYFTEKLRNGNWFYYDTILKYAMILFASSAYVYELYHSKGYKKTGNLFVVFFILLTGLYLSTIDFFDPM